MFETDKSLLLIPKDKSESNRFYYLKCLFLSKKDLTKKKLRTLHQSSKLLCQQ